MWISLIIALVVYLASPKSTPDAKRRALLAAGMAGAGTAFVTSQTDWGRDLNSSFNTTFGLDNSWTGFSGENDDTGSGSGSKTPGQIVKPPGTGLTGSIPGDSLFSQPPSWLGPAAGGVAVGAALSGVPTWVWLAGGGLILYAIMKD